MWVKDYAKHVATKLGYPTVYRDEVRGFMSFANANVPEVLSINMKKGTVALDICFGGVALTSKWVQPKPEEFYPMREKFVKYREVCMLEKNSQSEIT